MEENNVFTGKTLEEAQNNAMLALGLLKEELQFEVLEEGKKKLFGSTKWKIRATLKVSDGERTAAYIEGLLKIMDAEGKCEVESSEDEIKIFIKTENGSRVIGKRGEVLDAIQCIAGAVANSGREKYVKVIVDCENYRRQREETLTELARKVAQKAVETGRKVALEPMCAYERRIIHSALGESGEVKTVSEGREPSRYVVVIPENLKFDGRPIRYGDKPAKNRDRRGGDRRRGEGRRNGDRRREGGKKTSGGARRDKKAIYFGEFLGNSGAGSADGGDETDK